MTRPDSEWEHPTPVYPEAETDDTQDLTTSDLATVEQAERAQRALKRLVAPAILKEEVPNA